MQIKTTGYLAAWRAGFLAIAVNLILSYGVNLLNISNMHTSSMIYSIAYTIFAICLVLFASRKNLSAELYDMGFKGFIPIFIPFFIIAPIAAQFFCSMFTLPVNVISTMLLGAETKEQMMIPHGTAEFITAFGYMCILAPISEEIIFRGVIYKYLEKHSTLTAIFSSAVMFSMAHLDLRSLVPIFFIGLVLSLIRFATGSLWATIIAHSAVNLFSLLTMYTTSTAAVSAKTVGILFILFPICIALFLKFMPKKKLYTSGQRKSVSVYMILTIVLFVVFQLILISNNYFTQYSHRGDEYFQRYFEKQFGNFD